jgi:hypothetical protein
MGCGLFFDWTRMDDFIAWLNSLPEPDWLREPSELTRQPVRGRGGKPTGEYLPTGKESVEMMTTLFGETEMAREKKTKRAEMPEPRDGNQSLKRAQEASAAAILAPLDRVAHEMEQKWGVGRLQTLVSPEWAERFHSATTKLNLAISAGDLVLLREKADVLMRGWQKLDQLATEGGHQPWASADVWEVESNKGRVYAIARTGIDEINAQRRDGVRVITLAEVAMILDAWDEDGMVTELRAQFPGSQIVKAGRIAHDDRPDVGV